MFLVTVQHSGSMSLKKQFPEYEHRHCDKISLGRVKAGEHCITTYRDPALIADSWRRRGWLEHEKYQDIWFSQWAYYDAITRQDNVEVVPVDKLQQHINHVEGEDHPGEHLYLPMITHAYDCSKLARRKHEL